MNTITFDKEYVKMSILSYVMLPFIFLCVPFQSFAQSDTIIRTRKLEFAVDYLMPIDKFRNIQSGNINAFFWKKYFKKSSLFMSVGAVATYSKGDMTRFENDTTVNEIQIFFNPIQTKTDGFGLGPAVQIQYPIFTVKKITIEVEASGACILYNKKFPVGGSQYNFIFKPGLSFSYQINKNYCMKIGYRWMHISNGQGFGSHNPSYNSQGVSLAFSKFF